LMLPVGALAQSGTNGESPRHHYGTMWDARTVETQHGEVIAVDKYVPGRGGPASGLRLTMKTDRETIVVVLGPVSYVEGQQLTITPKDKLEIKGSRMSIDGQPALIAAEVKKGDKIVKLRDESGVPLWPRAR
jgi:hypothetical protein